MTRDLGKASTGCAGPTAPKWRGPSTPVAPTGLALGGSFGFDAAGVTDLSIVCFGPADDADAGAAALWRTMRGWLDATGRRLGFGPIQDVTTQSWTLTAV